MDVRTHARQSSSEDKIELQYRYRYSLLLRPADSAHGHAMDSMRLSALLYSSSASCSGTTCARVDDDFLNASKLARSVRLHCVDDLLLREDTALRRLHLDSLARGCASVLAISRGGVGRGRPPQLNSMAMMNSSHIASSSADQLLLA